MSDAHADDRMHDLVDAAAKARVHAYAPYSNFAVGAAVLAEDGRIFVGCNVENASYPVGTCAEAGAIAAMIAGGARRIVAIAVSGGADGTGLAPCGACRQRILEFAAPDAVVHCGGGDARGRIIPARDLLPYPFDGSDLHR